MGEVKLPAGGLADLRRAIEDTTADDAVRALREAGRRLAGEAEMAISDRGGGALSGLAMPRFWSEVNRYFQEAGWGRIEHEEMNGGLGGLLARDWAEADPNEGRETPGCHISTGLLAELLSRVVGQPVAVMEVGCRSRGEEACRFLFGSPTRLLSLHEKLVNSGSVDEALAGLS